MSMSPSTTTFLRRKVAEMENGACNEERVYISRILDNLRRHCSDLERSVLRNTVSCSSDLIPRQQLVSELTAAALPPRCSHHAITIHLDDNDSLLIVGGIAKNTWQKSCFIVSGLGAALLLDDAQERGKSISVEEVCSDSTDPLALSESAACWTGGSSLLVSGGVLESTESNAVWMGDASRFKGMSVNERL
jgi:hypothetical protein